MWKFGNFDKKHVIMILASTLILINSAVQSSYAQFAGGNGTVQDPWLISTAEHLDNIRDFLGEEHSEKHFLQIDDIDLDVPPWNENEGWVPIGFSLEESFWGVYNGNDHTIHGIFINRPDGGVQGLFGITRNSEISNLKLTNVNVLGSNSVGSLIGHSISDVISNIECSGNSYGNSNVGGVIGVAGYSVITDVHNSCTVSGDINIGGLIGRSFSSEVTYGNNSGTISGNWSTGGIAGVADEGYGLQSEALTNELLHLIIALGRQRYVYSRIERCTNIGAIHGNDRSGGVVGFLYAGSQLSNSYNLGEINGISRAGGLAGIVNILSVVQNCFSAGAVTGDIDIGGLIGMIDDSSSVSNSYWNTDTSGQTESDGGEGRTTDEMTYPYAANTYVDWDFAEIWAADVDFTINQGYPFLQEMPVSVDKEVIAVIESPILSNYPNPFNPETTMNFSLPQDTAMLDLKIYNIRGQLVRTLIAGTPFTKGEHQIVWDGRNDSGKTSASGIFFYRLTTPNFTQQKKMMLLK